MRAIAAMYRQLADLLRASVPLLRALRLVGRGKANPRLAAIMNGVADFVADGGHLADALAERPDVFPPVHVAMIRAAERGGFLEAVLRRLGTFIEHQADMRGKVIGNLFYPILLLCVGSGIAVFGLLVLVPRFRDFYADIELGLSTKILLALSALLTQHAGWMLAGVIALAAIVWWAKGRSAVRRRVAVMFLRLPKLGPLRRDLAVGRFARILGTLLENGIPLLPAMQISRDAVGHPLLATAIDDAIDAVRSGDTLAAPLVRCGMFSEDAIEIIAVGEAANNLAEVLLTLADTIEKRVDRMLAALVRLMEPMLLLMMGGMVFFLFLALVVPMLRMSSAIR
jgi:general secretion pathway protein F/type IV pilus assembly protein PilC